MEGDRNHEITSNFEPAYFFPSRIYKELSLDSQTVEYSLWLETLRPRTCLLVHWLANLGAVDDPGFTVRNTARRFADKRLLLGRLVDRGGGETSDKTNWLLEHGEFDIYVAWLMWLRFMEYVPTRFVKEDGRDRVLAWIRTQLRRPELTADETIVELRWQANRLRETWGTADQDLSHMLGM